MSKFALFEIYFNDEILRFTNANESVFAPTGTFIPMPSMEVSDIVLTGGMDSEDITIVYPISEDKTNLSQFVTSNIASESKQVNIYFLEDNQFKRKFRGRLKTAEKNPSGKPNHIKLYLSDIKESFDVSSGVQALDTCIQKFGSSCGVDLSAHDELVTIDLIADGGRRVTLGFSGSQAKEDKRYINGAITLKGVTFTIRKYVAGDAYLLRPMNPDWLDESATLTSGCRHNPESCSFYNNEKNYMALGQEMPSVNPIFESE